MIKWERHALGLDQESEVHCHIRQPDASLANDANGGRWEGSLRAEEVTSDEQQGVCGGVEEHGYT